MKINIYVSFVSLFYFKKVKIKDNNNVVNINAYLCDSFPVVSLISRSHMERIMRSHDRIACCAHMIGSHAALA